MKNAIIIILLAAVVALGALVVSQRNQAKIQTEKLAQATAQLAQAEAKVEEKSDAVEKVTVAETKARILQDTLTETAASVVAQSNQVAQLQAAAKTNTSNPLAAMLKDPKMKEMIKAQQKMVMGPLIEKNYAAAFKQLNLTPEQTANLKELLQSKMLVGADAGMAMMDGSLDADKRAELGKQIKADTDAFDKQIKELLGEANDKTFEAYEKTVPDRMAISPFHDQLAGSANPLSADQEDLLIRALNEERTNFKWTTDYNNKNPADGDFTKMFTEEKLNIFEEEQTRLDEQVLGRVKQILTPEQYKIYEKYQETQRAMRIAGMKMAAQVFGK